MCIRVVCIYLPHRDHEDDPGQQLNSRESPMRIRMAVGVLSERIASFLVVNIVEHISEVPDKKVRSKFDIFDIE